MTKGKLQGRLLTGAISVLLGTWSVSAYASAFQLVEQNGSGLGNAQSGQAAAAEDASTVFFNPAGLTRIPGVQVVGSVSAIRLKTTFRNTGSQAAPLQTLGSGGGDAGDWEFVPNGYVSLEVLPGTIWAGLGVNVPFGLETDWDADWIGRFYAIKSDVKTVNINPTVAWKVLPWLSVGAGANAQRISATLTNGVNYAALGRSPLLGEGIARVEATDWSWGWNVGAMLELPSQTRLGVSYRSVVKHSLGGNVTFVNRPAPLAPALPDGSVTADIHLPDTASAAIAQQVTRALQLLADFTWTGWASIQELTINRTNPPAGVPAGLSNILLRFKDSWRVGLGGNYQLTDAWKLRLGFAYDRTPVRDEFRTPRLPDQDRVWVAAGAQWAFSSYGAIDAGFAHLFVKDASSNLQSAANGNLVGTYNANVWILGAQARLSF